jgi:hypothetical protein
MRDLVYQLTRGFAFAGVDHKDLKFGLRVMPVLFAIAAGMIFAVLPDKPLLTGEGSLSRHLLSVFSTLPGFFIAALAAVSTFTRPEMDETMPAPAPRLKLRVGDESDWVDLTFRMFLAHLFAYVTTLAFLAVFIFVSVDLLHQSGDTLLKLVVPPKWLSSWSHFLNAGYVALAVGLTANIVLTTLLGIYFLAERIHRPNS